MQTRRAFTAEEKRATVQKATVCLIFFHIPAFTIRQTGGGFLIGSH